MPYSQLFREKLRIWQALIVMVTLLDPQIYTKEFRDFRVHSSGSDILQEINT
jgi:hypothetical protein